MELPVCTESSGRSDILKFWYFWAAETKECWKVNNSHLETILGVFPFYTINIVYKKKLL